MENINVMLRALDSDDEFDAAAYDGFDPYFPDSDDDLYDNDPVCAICDDGGYILSCEGICMRSFHATPRSAAQSGCISLGFTETEVKNMRYFLCRNCQSKRHQCYSCRQLGSSDIQAGAEVFQCDKATCGYFYHPKCVAQQLNRDNEDAARQLEERIRAGEPFNCPHHICCVCQHAEDATDRPLQMAVCRRCPKAYHRRCLPGDIVFGNVMDPESEDEDTVPRAWDKMLPKRILFYCLDHEIDEHLKTPLQNHIKFPVSEVPHLNDSDTESVVTDA